MRTKAKVLAFLGLIVSATGALDPSVSAAELGAATVTNFEVPLFDRSGKLTHRIHAASATGLERPVLHDGTIDFFGEAESVERTKLATLTFDEARYDDRAKLIDSDSRMEFLAPEGKISAVGFRYEILTRRLFLKTAVTMTLPEARIAGGEAEILLVEIPSTRELLVDRAEIRRNVVVTDIKTKIDALRFDRIETSTAWFVGSENLLRLANPVKTWSQGIPGGAQRGEVSYRLARPLPPVKHAAKSADGERKE